MINDIKYVDDDELINVLVKVAEKKNPFDFNDVCDYYKLPKYGRSQALRELNGINSARIGNLVSKHPDFEREVAICKSGVKWKCLKVPVSNLMLPSEYKTDEEILNALCEIVENINPFNYYDICMYYGVSRTDRGIQILEEKYGINPVRVGIIISSSGKIKRFNDTSLRHTKWCKVE